MPRSPRRVRRPCRRSRSRRSSRSRAARLAPRTLLRSGRDVVRGGVVREGAIGERAGVAEDLAEQRHPDADVDRLPRGVRRCVALATRAGAARSMTVTSARRPRGTRTRRRRSAIRRDCSRSAPPSTRTSGATSRPPRRPIRSTSARRSTLMRSTMTRRRAPNRTVRAAVSDPSACAVLTTLNGTSHPCSGNSTPRHARNRHTGHSTRTREPATSNTPWPTPTHPSGSAPK